MSRHGSYTGEAYFSGEVWAIVVGLYLILAADYFAAKRLLLQRLWGRFLGINYLAGLIT